MHGEAVPSYWTEERIATLTKDWEDGKSASESARRLGGSVTRNAVIAKRHRLGLTEAGRKTGPACRARNVALGIASAKVAKRPGPRSPMAIPPARRLGPDHVRPVREVDPIYSGAPAPDSPGLKTLLERGPRECAWPVGAPDPDRGQLFCSAPIVHSAYCGSHHTGRGQSTRQLDSRDPMVMRVNAGRPRRDPNPALAKWGREW